MPLCSVPGSIVVAAPGLPARHCGAQHRQAQAHAEAQIARRARGRQLNIFVIGGNGLVGRNIVQRLRIHGHRVCAVSRSTGVDLITGKAWPTAWRAPTWWST